MHINFNPIYLLNKTSTIRTERILWAFSDFLQSIDTCTFEFSRKENESRIKRESGRDAKHNFRDCISGLADASCLLCQMNAFSRRSVSYSLSTWSLYCFPLKLFDFWFYLSPWTRTFWSHFLVRRATATWASSPRIICQCTSKRSIAN